MTDSIKYNTRTSYRDLPTRHLLAVQRANRKIARLVQEALDERCRAATTDEDIEVEVSAL